MSIQMKSSVVFADPKQALPFIAMIVASVYHMLGFDTCVITSAGDSVHPGKAVEGTSKDPHYEGLALDFRLNDIQESYYDRILTQCKLSLGNCDAMIRSKGTQNVHMHIQYNPTHKLADENA